MKNKRLFFSFVILIAGMVNSWSGGPLIVRNGSPVLWDVENGRNLPIRFSLDEGRLGSLSNAAARRMVRDAFTTWRNVSGSTLIFQEDNAPIREDITADNFMDEVDRITTSTDNIVIAFDDTGEIIDLLGGDGARNNILGLSSPLTFFVNGEVSIAAGFFVLNGFFIEQNRLSTADYLPIVLHELGHALGLDHAQFNSQFSANGIESDDVFLPVMFPLFGDADDIRDQLTYDDQTALSNLYSTTSHRVNTGGIAGAVSRNGNELPGVNIIARKTTDLLNKVASTVTGTFDPNSGRYLLEGLEPGEYEVLAEAINFQFTAGSGVGQHSRDLNDLSFIFPILSEFYNENDSTIEGRSVLRTVNVRRGGTTEGIDIQADPLRVNMDERDSTLLPIGSSIRGGTINTQSFILNPNGDEGQIEVTIDFTRALRHIVRVRRDSLSSPFLFEEAGSDDNRIVFSRNGDVPIAQAPFFIEVINQSSSELIFDVHAEQSDPPTPTRTPTSTRTPTRTDTPTRTPTETDTPVPTDTPEPEPVPTATFTFTPTPQDTPTPTPTPTMIALDQDGDGVLTGLDLFRFARFWEESIEEAGIQTMRLQLHRWVSGFRDSEED